MAEYYRACDEFYKKAAACGAGICGTSENDADVCATLEKWVGENSLSGKGVLQCACGEGSEGIILSRLGCLYWGTDVSLTAVGIARGRLEEYSGARIFFMDMVKNQIAGKYDGILDCRGLCMLVTDGDRRKYLENIYFALKDGASALFMREPCDENAFSGAVDSFEDWQKITGEDYEAPVETAVSKSGKTVMAAKIPERSKSKDGYIKELEEIGFKIEGFDIGKISDGAPVFATIKARK